MELKDTIDMMNSQDYKERIKAEYAQVKIRYTKLKNMVKKYEDGTLDFKPSCSLELLTEQCTHMFNYIKCLEERAKIENVDLGGL